MGGGGGGERGGEGEEEGGGGQDIPQSQTADQLAIHQEETQIRREIIKIKVIFINLPRRLPALY